MSIFAATANVNVIQKSKFFQSFGLTNEEGQPLNITEDSGVGRIIDSEGNEILQLPSITDSNLTGIITNQTGIISMSIAIADYDSMTVDMDYDYDIQIDLSDFPELSPHKPIRGNIVLLTGAL